ncbi:hypothetical protein Patl1_20337 [Pistacia atlantica]|uniref:Uncharacterized protein n=1 Tax=Pistacia atlantica TaxID=434234 RepID=A0ACC1BM87_9ROSI|nr:hypothetical protein Patl1_20337 [Pistacia atlantica]
MLLTRLWHLVLKNVCMDTHCCSAVLQSMRYINFSLHSSVCREWCLILKGSILYIDLAKSNSRPKHSRTGFGSIHIPRTGNSAYNMIGYPSTQRLGNLNARAASEITAAKLVGRHFSLLFFLSQFQFLAVTYLLFLPAPNCNHSSVPPNVPKIGTPCPTLFVANLGPTCTEQGLIQVFSRCPRYLKLKMQSTHGALIAFVDCQG